MTVSTELPAWIREGAKVAVYDTNNGGSAHYATIVRLTKTQAVLDNGDRYRLDTLRKVGEQRGSWSGYTELMSVDNPRVRATIANRTVDSLLYEIGRLGGGRMSLPRALEVLDEIDARVAVARKLIAGPPPSDGMDRAARAAGNEG